MADTNGGGGFGSPRNDFWVGFVAGLFAMGIICIALVMITG